MLKPVESLGQKIEPGILEAGERYGISPYTLIELSDLYISEFHAKPRTFLDLLEAVE